jgi:SecD/SecF fusion protein
VLTDEQLIQRLRAALERESAGVVPPPGLLASIHEELRSSPAAERRRWRAPSRGLRPRLAHLAPVAALLVVVAVVAVFLGVRSRKPAGSAAAHGGFALVFRAEPTPPAAVVNPAAMARAVSLVRGRIAAVVPGAEATIAVTSAGTKIFVHAASQARISEQQLLSLVGTTARMVLYDWEANALTPSGEPVASLLLTQDPSALAISQGAGPPGPPGPPGSPGAGSMPLYRAVKLAAKQPTRASSTNARLGPEYFAFGAPGSSACARAYHGSQIVGQHCYLAGPQDNLSALHAAMPNGVSTSSNGVETLTVRQGWVVLQALPSGGFNQELPWSDPSAQYYVLRDRVALSGNEITNPQQSTDQSGSPNVTFGFTRAGGSAFQTVTAQVAHRGALVSGVGHALNQHFAVALDTQLLTVPLIDFKAYPDGIPGESGADIFGAFTRTSARQLAEELRLGPLPVHLTLLSINGRNAHSS